MREGLEGLESRQIAMNGEEEDQQRGITEGWL